MGLSLAFYWTWAPAVPANGDIPGFSSKSPTVFQEPSRSLGNHTGWASGTFIARTGQCALGEVLPF